jgi:hypothetical protein
MFIEIEQSTGFAILTVMLVNVFFGSLGMCVRSCLNRYSIIDLQLCWGLLNIKNNKDMVYKIPDIEMGNESVDSENII